MEMKSYSGFAYTGSVDDIICHVMNDPADRRWQSARAIARLDNIAEIEKAGAQIKETLKTLPDDWKQYYRLQLAVCAVDYAKKHIISAEKEAAGEITEDPARCEMKDSPVQPCIDFHVHPKAFDAQMMSDMDSSGLTNMVILATDTDPADADREDIQQHIYRMCASSFEMMMTPPQMVVAEIRNSLYSPTHVTNQDVADWMSDYPDRLIGFGSVDLCKSAEYVDSTLTHISELGLKGIKLLPFSQFFDPADCTENLEILFEHCRKNGWPILSHTGCSSGIFEDPAFNQESRPVKWEEMASRYPDVRMVMAHLGAYSRYYPGIWLEEAADMIGRHENIYADTAAVCGLLNNEDAVKMIRKKAGGFSKVLFGTDYPMPTMMEGGEAAIITEIMRSPLLTDTEKEGILGINAASLLRI